MAISPLEFNGTITRAQDFTTLKQNEDNKGLINQTNFQTQFNKEVDQHLKTVRNPDNAEDHEYRYDGKEKGNGEYGGDGGRRRKKKEEEKEDKVVVKGIGGFDMKI